MVKISSYGTRLSTKSATGYDPQIYSGIQAGANAWNDVFCCASSKYCDPGRPQFEQRQQFKFVA